MIDINSWHPFARYGVAAAIVQLEEDIADIDFSSLSALLELADEALEDSLTGFLLEKRAVAGQPNKWEYKSLAIEKLDPGKKSGQITANGYFIAPHALTNNNAAAAVQEIKTIRKLIEEGKTTGNYELKRSFTPLIAKFNAGKKSMSNPKVAFVNAAFSAVAMATNIKPAAFNYDTAMNMGLIPDLPFYDAFSGKFPLVNYVRIFSRIQDDGLGVDARRADYLEKEKKYKRPDLFYGNYPYAPKTGGLGVVSVIAALGNWAERHRLQQREKSEKVDKLIATLVQRPIYIISYAGTTQQSFGHHLVDMAKSGYLYAILKNAYRTQLPSVDLNKYSNPKWKHFTRTLDHFLRFYNAPAWRDFLANRAFYPIEFTQLFKKYFMDVIGLTEAVVLSALAYGKSLNNAAYNAAVKQVEEDKKANRKGAPTKEEYKNRTLTQFESTIRSAKTKTALFAQMGTIVGRLTMRDINADAGHFIMESVKQDSPISIKTAQDLIIAFMRLSTYDSSKGASSPDVTANQSVASA